MAKIIAIDILYYPIFLVLFRPQIQKVDKQIEVDIQ